jgi:hypothetical protein
MRVRDPTGIGKARSDWRFNLAGRVSLRRYLHFQCNSRLFRNENLWVMHSSEEGNCPYGRIARLSGSTPRRLCRSTLNPLTEPLNLKIGQRLRLRQ